MERKTKVTKIEKTFKDKNGKQKSITIDYAKVADRLKVFREDHPNSKITNKCHQAGDGTIIFKAYIWKDKAEFIELLKSGVSGTDALESADSEGSVRAEATKLQTEKGYEKQETIAVGRALALLGYAASGEIASAEEMEEFEQFKKDKAAEAAESAQDALKAAKSVDELKKVWLGFTRELRANPDIAKVKDEAKAKLEKKPEPKKKETKK